MRRYLEELEKNGMVLHVRKEVDPVYELSAAAKRLHKAFGKAIVFENVKGSSFPVVSYIYPNRDSVVAGLNMISGQELEQWAARESKTGIVETVETAPVQEVVETGAEIDLFKFPIITHSIGDAGPYITGGAVLAKNPDNGIINASFNRLQLVDKDKLRVRMMPPQHLGLCHAAAEAKNMPLEAAIVIGASPALMFSAASKIPYDRSELEFAGALAEEPLKVVKCKTIDLEVPADAEIVIEGEVLPNVREEEGPFGEFTDSYVPHREHRSS
jgi:2,5-furandicarboxylate decarboxylase 1